MEKTVLFTAAEFCSSVLLFLLLSIYDNVFSVSGAVVTETLKAVAKENNFP